MRANPAGWPYQDPDNDVPDWTGDDDRVAGGASPGWPYGEDHPSWPAGSDHPDWPRGGGAAYYDVAAEDGWDQTLLPAASTGQPPQITANGPAEPLDPAWLDTGGLQGEDSLRLTQRILSDADSEAAAITQEALQQASAIREAAEREADELRAGAIRLSAELGEVAAYVTRTLTTSAMPVPELPAQSGQHYTEGIDGYPRSGGGPQTWEPDAAWEPETWPPPARPATRHVRRTEKPPRSRQSRAMLAFAGTITALVVLVLGTGAYQLATRGFTFFVFRSAGTGATDNNAVFPGIIPTPKPSPAHQHPKTGRGQHGARRIRHHAKSAAGR